MNPASRVRIAPCDVEIFSGRPLNVVLKVNVLSGFIVTAPVTSPDEEISTDLPLVAVKIMLKRLVSKKPTMFPLESKTGVKLSTKLPELAPETSQMLSFGLVNEKCVWIGPAASAAAGNTAINATTRLLAGIKRRNEAITDRLMDMPSVVADSIEMAIKRLSQSGVSTFGEPN